MTDHQRRVVAAVRGGFSPSLKKPNPPRSTPEHALSAIRQIMAMLDEKNDNLGDPSIVSFRFRASGLWACYKKGNGRFRWTGRYPSEHEARQAANDGDWRHLP